ncbi:hypothetical protein BX666DRAFT_1502611 [Dichotomocladium elegans]|nr:hypothetical protein BX666DRAFT_1502611 [Dichotomocladium elegans]
MSEPMKRKISSTDNTIRAKRSAKAPSIATTKATLARAAAIKFNNSQSAGAESRTRNLNAKTTPGSAGKSDRKSLEGKVTGGGKPAINAKETKRPSWDIRGRMSDMESQLQKDREKIGKLETYRDGLMSTVKDKDTEISTNIQQIAEIKADIQLKERMYQQISADTRSQYQDRIQRLEDLQRNSKSEIDVLESDLADANRNLQDIDSKADKEMNDNIMLKKTISDSTAAFKDVEGQILALKLKLTRADDTLASREQLIQKLRGELEAEAAVTDKLEAKFDEETRNRKRLEATIAELGNRTELVTQTKKKTL